MKKAEEDMIRNRCIFWRNKYAFYEKEKEYEKAWMARRIAEDYESLMEQMGVPFNWNKVADTDCSWR